MKKIISLLLMSIFLVSCGSSDNNKKTTENNTNTGINTNAETSTNAEINIQSHETVAEEELSDEELDKILNAFFDSVKD